MGFSFSKEDQPVQPVKRECLEFMFDCDDVESLSFDPNDLGNEHLITKTPKYKKYEKELEELLRHNAKNDFVAHRNIENDLFKLIDKETPLSLKGMSATTDAIGGMRNTSTSDLTDMMPSFSSTSDFYKYGKRYI